MPRKELTIIYASVTVSSYLLRSISEQSLPGMILISLITNMADSGRGPPYCGVTWIIETDTSKRKIPPGIGNCKHERFGHIKISLLRFLNLQ